MSQTLKGMQDQVGSVHTRSPVCPDLKEKITACLGANKVRQAFVWKSLQKCTKIAHVFLMHMQFNFLTDKKQAFFQLCKLFAYRVWFLKPESNLMAKIRKGSELRACDLKIVLKWMSFNSRALHSTAHRWSKSSPGVSTNRGLVTLAGPAKLLHEPETV